MKGTTGSSPYGMRRSDNPAFVGGSFSTSLPTITELSFWAEQLPDPTLIDRGST